MDYDVIFNENIDRNFFFSSYPGNKLMVGKISLENAIARMAKNEYYVLVTYKDGQQLPIQYVPYKELESSDGSMYATISPSIRISSLVRNNGIQLVSRLGAPTDKIRYLLGPGPDQVYLDDLIAEQYEETISKDKGKSI